MSIIGTQKNKNIKTSVYAINNINFMQYSIK